MSQPTGYLTQGQVDKLLAGINPRRVSKDPKGFSYVEAYELRAMMNRIFGFGRWSQDVIDQQPIYETKTEKDGKDRWTVCYRTIVRVTINAPDGTLLATFTEGATGESTNQPVRGDAHDNALKTSQSQAFKRAVANLGDAFGLSLWGKGSVKPIVFATLHYPFTKPEGEQQEQRSDVDSHITEQLPPEDAAPDVPEDLRETNGKPPTSQPNGNGGNDALLPGLVERLWATPTERPAMYYARIQADAAKHGLLKCIIQPPDGTTPITVKAAIDGLLAVK